MPLRVPPGRAGRIWLVRRLEVAERGADLLERKRTALLSEQVRARGEVAVARRAWEAASAQVVRWSGRAVILDGAGRLELLSRHTREPAEMELAWSNLMGARMPAVARMTLPTPPQFSALGASAATVPLVYACREAIEAAARLAVAERAEAALSAELARAARRLRALRDRWIPQHQQALEQLDLALDESQREQAVRVRWLTRRTGFDAR